MITRTRLGATLSSAWTIVALACSCGSASAQTKVESINVYLTAAQGRGQLNGCVLVGEKGRIVYNKAFGLADFQKRTPLRTDAVFELASVSKPFTALAIMMLSERGRLSYDDLLTRYIPELPYQGVTIRRMLTHTAGLPEPDPLFGSNWPSDKAVTNAVFVKRLADQKLSPLFAPGDRWRYDRTAYFLLARIVEIVSGTSYEEFLESNVFKPLGMKNSSVFNTRITGTIPNLARASIHPSMWSDEYVMPETLPRYRYSVYWGDTTGPMGIHSSTEDLFKWTQALNNGKLVKKKTLAQAYTPVKLNDGSTPSAGGGAGNGRLSHYGFGWFLQEGPDGKTVRHTGDWRGYITCLVHNLDKDQTIVVLTNAGDLSAVGLADGLESLLNNRPYHLPKQSIGRAIGKAIFAGKLAAATRLYHDLKQSHPDSYDFENEGELNSLGYDLLRRGEKQRAIEVFKINAEAFPSAWNVYDSLGEAYLANGNKELAMESYRRSVELNPQNGSGREALNKLKADRLPP
jgi:CubicO group peptidase (beta-lactamase class C family)